MKSIAPLRRHLCPTFAKPSSARPLLFTSLSSAPPSQPPLTTRSRNNIYNLSNRSFTTTFHPRMSGFSNTDTGSKPADPYKAKNIDHASLKEKVEDLVQFIEACKFGMMTTRVASSGLLVSRCMALAGKVNTTHHSIPPEKTKPPRFQLPPPLRRTTTEVRL